MNEEALTREGVTASEPSNPVPPSIPVLAKPSDAT